MAPIQNYLYKNRLIGKIFVYETSAVEADLILRWGFHPGLEGIVFYRDTDKTPTAIGRCKIRVKLNVPDSKVLDVEYDTTDDLTEDSSAWEIAHYARRNGFRAWVSGVRTTVLDARYIEIVSTSYK